MSILDNFRRNINQFSDTSTFEPYCEISEICQQETDLWNSENPVGSIVKIDIPAYDGWMGNTFGNDGVVVTAEYDNANWRFMTMEAPYDASHPVSGTRQFGYEINTDGSFNFFVRGVDRFTSGSIYSTLDFFLDNPFFGADDLWGSFQENINTFVNSNGGSSSIIAPVINRPDWDKVREVLEGERPISDLGCN